MTRRTLRNGEANRIRGCGSENEEDGSWDQEQEGYSISIKVHEGMNSILLDIH